MQKMVTAMLNLNSPPKYTDISDALALAIAHSHTLRSKI
ncbi:MAG: crossover junction endodeoxyribonuclease RuvC [Candidatus Omnitrophica bacterium]|nr:crossover junction endodeoxyribonuclease RuvC [Candidatus Omnitrophota bacterium]